MSSTRTPLSRERILETALALADEDGVEAVTMRKLADRLGFEAMSLYRHVASKNDLLGGMLDVVVAEWETEPEGDWRPAVRVIAVSVHTSLRRHPWAAPLLRARPMLMPTTRRARRSMSRAPRSGDHCGSAGLGNCQRRLGGRSLRTTQ